MYVFEFFPVYFNFYCICAHTGGLVPTQPVQGLVELSGINFSYPSRPDISVLRDFTLTVPSGSVMAIVGASGSGKSTITSLLLRYYDPLAGEN